jgi:hypothetical protein
MDLNNSKIDQKTQNSKNFLTLDLPSQERWKSKNTKVELFILNEIS